MKNHWLAKSESKTLIQKSNRHNKYDENLVRYEKYKEFVDKQVNLAENYLKFWLNPSPLRPTHLKWDGEALDSFWLHLNSNLKCLAIYGDLFLLKCYGKDSNVCGFIPLLESGTYRIENIHGKLLEYQCGEGVDWQAFSICSIEKAKDQDLITPTAHRFYPDQIVHFRLQPYWRGCPGTYCLGFYHHGVYGTSLLDESREFSEYSYSRLVNAFSENLASLFRRKNEKPLVEKNEQDRSL